MILLSIITISTACSAVTLPVDCDFSWDVPGEPPSTGGANQPTSLSPPAGGSILVQAAALGLNDRPCLIDQAGNGAYGSINFQFDPVLGDLLVFEATISVDSLTDNFVMQTAAHTGAVASRLYLSDSGQIADHFGTILGDYAPGLPFRCRMSVNMSDKNWDCVIDDEMDGFANDPVIEDLPLVNDPSNIDDLSQALASLGYTTHGGFQAAYDDISIRVEQIASAAESSWSSVKRGF